MVAAVYPSFVPPPPSASSPTGAPHKLRTYIVLNAKSSRGRLASFEETSSSASTSASSSPATSPLRAAAKTLRIPDECLAYESYAAVASRFHGASSPSTSPTRDLRWSDISRPALAAAPAKPLSQKARRRQMQLRRARAASGSSSSANDHLETHALELCFEFLALADLQRATAVCTEFRDVVTRSGRLLVALYAREWRGPAAPPMARAYASLAFAPALEMVRQRRRDAEYALSARSLVTTRADATVEILNNSLLRVLTRGAVDSARGVKALPVQPCAVALGQRVSYFEVAMSGCGSVGVVSVSDPATRRAYGYGSDEHVGWKGISCGYHGNDGDFVFNDGAAPYGGEWTPYGPSWGVRKTKDGDEADEAAWPMVGCGLDLAARRVFFTLNGTFLGFASFAVPEGEYAAAVSLHEFNDRAVLNAGSAPFRFDIEGFCASL